MVISIEVFCYVRRGARRAPMDGLRCAPIISAYL